MQHPEHLSSSKINQHLIKTVLEHPKKLIFISLLVLIFFSSYLPQLQAKYNVRSWFKTHDPLLKELDRFELQFGNDEAAIFILEFKDHALTAQNYNWIKNVTNEIWKVESVIRVESLSNYQFIEVLGDDINIAPLTDQDRPNLIELDKIKEKIQSDHNIKDRFISADLKYSFIYAHLNSPFDQPLDYKALTRQMEKIKDQFSSDEARIILTGSGIVNDAMRSTAEHDLITMVPTMFVIIIIILGYLYRSLPAVGLPLLLWGLVTCATYGFSAFLSIPFDNLTSAVPAVMLAVALADSIHILNTYYSLTQTLPTQEALIKTLDKNITPTFLTSLSTSIGFGALILTDLKPIQHLGILCTFGTILAWFLTIFFIPSIILILRKDSTKHLDPFNTTIPKQRKVPQLPAKWFAKTIINHHKIIFISTTLLTLGGIYLASKAKINVDPTSFFTEGHPIKEASDLLLVTMNGVSGPQIVIDSQFEHGAKDPLFLKRVDELDQWMKKQPNIRTTFSILDVIKKMNQALNENKTGEYRIPDTKEQVAESLFLYQLGLPQGLDMKNIITVDERSIRLSVLWPIMDSERGLKMAGLIEHKAQELGLDIKIVGKLHLYHRMNDYIVKTFLISFGVAMFLITLIMIKTLKSSKLGLISMIPNILPLGIGLGVVGVLGMDINNGTSIVASIALGIAIDDTIHFLVNFQQVVKRNSYGTKLSTEELYKCFEEVYKTTGSALFFTTLILILGFGIFVFAQFKPNVDFGLLTSLVLFLALLLDLFYLPSLLTWTMKKKTSEKKLINYL